MRIKGIVSILFMSLCASLTAVAQNSDSTPAPPPSGTLAAQAANMSETGLQESKGVTGRVAVTPSQWAMTTGFFQDYACDMDWWHTFGDATLDSLISLGTANNYNIAIAARRIAVARQALRSARSGYFPTVAASAGWNKSRQSGLMTSPGTDAINTSYFQAGVDLSWQIDIFGKITSRAKQSKEQLKATRAEFEATMVTLCGDIATAYINLRSCQAQLQVAREQIESQKHVLKTAQARFEADLASKLDVAQASTIVHSTEAMIPQLETAEAEALNSLALLCGVYPGAMRSFLNNTPEKLPDFNKVVGVGIPADLIRRRPDLAEAEYSIAAAAEGLGVARKEWLPSLSIDGSVGLASHKIGDMGKNAAFTWSVAPKLTWTIFDGLARESAISSAREQLQMQIDSYNEAVLNAVCEVENAMNSYNSALQACDDYRQVFDDASEAFKLSYDLYRDGLSSFTDVANSQVNMLQYARSLVESHASAAQSLITLYEALGGGWQTGSAE